MELKDAACALASLGSEPRLRIFILLSEYGGEGISAGELAAQLKVPTNTLSFHLKELTQTGLIQSRREGRSIIYSINAERVGAMLQFLTVDCCFGNPGACFGPQNQAIPEGADRTRVLFICNHNSARSQMAEALLRHHGGKEYFAMSAGFEPREVDPRAILVMAERGIDIRRQASKSLRQLMSYTTVEHVIFVCQSSEEHCPRLYPFARNSLRWIIDAPGRITPAETDELQGFREVRDTIEKKVIDWISSINRSRLESESDPKIIASTQS